MAVNTETLTCPQCGANLVVQNGKDYTFCIYCGTKVMLRNDNVHIYRNYDEAKIRQADTERIVKLREMEIAEKEKERKRIGKIIGYSIAIVLIIIGVIIVCFDNEIGAIFISVGIFLGVANLFKDDSSEENKKKPVGPDEVALTVPMMYYEDRGYQSMVMLYRGAGFTNVSAVPLKDLGKFGQRKNGWVEQITINGSDEFEVGDIIKKDACILITYHSN